MTKKLKCPKCDSQDEPEILYTWGKMVEIFCNSCSRTSIIDNGSSGELPGHQTLDKGL
jgi:hypothetical protein